MAFVVSPPARRGPGRTCLRAPTPTTSRPPVGGVLVAGHHLRTNAAPRSRLIKEGAAVATPNHLDFPISSVAPEGAGPPGAGEPRALTSR
jgi:hypothetical protein